MNFKFGPFHLDEAGRTFRKFDQEVPLQPRVFDLLIYLIRNRDRVVPKDELLDGVWPGVTVTDNSLQRAISTLRSVLRDSGMDDAIRSFSRNGYRFCATVEEPESNQGQPYETEEILEEAKKAIVEQRWEDAITAYEMADDATTLDGDDLDQWALALQCIGYPARAIPIFTRASAAHTQSQKLDAAALSAVALSTIHLEKGDLAVAKGWLARAEDLVSQLSTPLSAGHILWMQSRIAASGGEPSRALEFAANAHLVGRQTGDIRVEALGLMYRGFFKLSLGDTRGGLADQDHAATLGLSTRLDPVTGGVLYCNILWACRTFGDWARANEWTLGYQEYCTASHVGFSGACQLHRAEVLGVNGSLQDALAHVNDAVSKLSDDAPWAVGDAHRVLGDIHSALGNSDKAFDAYRHAYTLGWDPEPGHAMLLLELGEVDAACKSLERSLIGQGWWTLQRRGVLLAHLAVTSACAGYAEKAQSIIDELSGQSERWPMPSIRALTNEASAVLARLGGKSDEAIRYLHLARQLWTAVNSRYNATRLRTQIASLLLEQVDINGAKAEIRAARDVATELGAGKLEKLCIDLEQRATGKHLA